MSANEDQPHLVVIPENDANRQITGFKNHGDIDHGQIQVERVAGGWLEALRGRPPQEVRSACENLMCGLTPGRCGLGWAPMSFENWMCWEGGVDLVAATEPGLGMPNVIVHLARMVHTPVGSAPSGMVLWQPDPAVPPVVCGFVSTDEAVGAYFGKHIFAGTPFENAPVIKASIRTALTADAATARVDFDGFSFATTLTGLGPAVLIQRAPLPTAPFHQQGLEAPAAAATLMVNHTQVPVIIPPVGITGGPCAVVAPCGIYAR